MAGTATPKHTWVLSWVASLAAFFFSKAPATAGISLNTYSWCVHKSVHKILKNCNYNSVFSAEFHSENITEPTIALRTPPRTSPTPTSSLCSAAALGTGHTSLGGRLNSPPDARPPSRVESSPPAGTLVVVILLLVRLPRHCQRRYISNENVGCTQIVFMSTLSQHDNFFMNKNQYVFTF